MPPPKPARPGYPGMMSPTGSTPNLASSSFSTLPPHWSASTTHLPGPGGGPGGSHHDFSRMGYNTIAGHPHHWNQRHSPGPYSQGQFMYPPNSHVPSSSMSHLPSSSYYASAPPTDTGPPTLGYIVAYTPEQLAEIMRDQYPAQSQGSGYNTSGYGSNWSPSQSPKRPLSVATTHPEDSPEHARRMEELQQKLLQQKLQQQQRQSEADAKWLQREEEAMVSNSVSLLYIRNYFQYDQVN